jgi:hypothetical protein
MEVMADFVGYAMLREYFYWNQPYRGEEIPGDDSGLLSLMTILFDLFDKISPTEATTHPNSLGRMWGILSVFYGESVAEIYAKGSDEWNALMSRPIMLQSTPKLEEIIGTYRVWAASFT